MTFEEILDQAIAMLQRRGRLTYGTLKRQFQLDDAALEDLKNELIEGQRLAVDERGKRVLNSGGIPCSRRSGRVRSAHETRPATPNDLPTAHRPTRH